MRWRSAHPLRERLAHWIPRTTLVLAAWPLRALPGPWLRWGCRIAFTAAAARPPRSAMRALLEIDDDLTGCIDQAALRYDDGVHVKHRLMDYHAFFVGRVRPGERVLDIGCGYGAVAYSLVTRAGTIVTGIDRNADSIALARRRFPHRDLTFIAGDALRDLPREPFETIVLSNTLEHIEHRVEFLVSVQSRVRPRRWLIRVPMLDRDWRVPLRRELGMFYFSDATHFTEYTRESFEAEMEAAGLGVRHLQVNWGEIWVEVSAGV